MARKKLNKNQRAQRRLDKLNKLKSISLEGIEIKVHKSGLPVTPTPQNKTVSDFSQDSEQISSKLKARYIELFGDDNIYKKKVVSKNLHNGTNK